MQFGIPLNILNEHTSNPKPSANMGQHTSVGLATLALILVAFWLEVLTFAWHRTCPR